MEQYRRETQEEVIDNKWENLKLSIQRANKILPPKDAKKKQAWITDEILNRMSERRKVKQNIHGKHRLD